MSWDRVDSVNTPAAVSIASVSSVLFLDGVWRPGNNVRAACLEKYVENK